MILNINNCENLIFRNDSLKSKLKNKEKFFYLYNFSKAYKLNSIKINLILDFLKSLDSNDLKIISSFFNQDIKIRILNNDIIKNDCIDLNNENCITSNLINICIHRNKDKLNITTWGR